MILYFATILLAVNNAITIVSSEDTSQACIDAKSTLVANVDCYNSIVKLNYSESVSLETAQAYCTPSCRSLFTNYTFCVSFT